MKVWGGTERNRHSQESELCLWIPSHTETIDDVWVVEMTNLAQMEDINSRGICLQLSCRSLANPIVFL